MARGNSERSERGNPTTQLERELLAAAASTPSCSNAWLIIGHRIGADALAVVLDELAGEKVHVPSRADFFGALVRERTDAQIRELYAQGRTANELAARFGIKPRTVWWILQGRPQSERKRAKCGSSDDTA
jgi:hypothetical protein